ncbi:uncharacterized protein LOC130979832 [Arachis stenosperma]|uniref:uncharacterized protein LOC130979832 n=1 Tax=Arachis stenosperma TaxID=217475 RepID=UPI0025ABF0A3|nr:uncharacterized protein LOC130979832 [Arachis stenosperma]
MIFLGLLLGPEFKVSAIVSFVFVFVCNFIFGFLPYVDNFASIGGFVSRFLLGSVLLPSRKLEVSYQALRLINNHQALTICINPNILRMFYQKLEWKIQKESIKLIGLYMQTPQIQSSLASCTKVLLPIKDVPDGNDPMLGRQKIQVRQLA